MLSLAAIIRRMQGADCLACMPVCADAIFIPHHMPCVKSLRLWLMYAELWHHEMKPFMRGVKAATTNLQIRLASGLIAQLVRAYG